MCIKVRKWQTARYPVRRLITKPLDTYKQIRHNTYTERKFLTPTGEHTKWHKLTQPVPNVRATSAPC